MALLAIAAVITVFLYPTVNLPATKLKRPLVLAAALLLSSMVAAITAQWRTLRREAVASVPVHHVPLEDLLCARLC
jgi:hypothetical protein